jgi:hypothetical protein
MDRSCCWSQGRESASTPNNKIFKIIDIFGDDVCTIDDLPGANISGEEIIDERNADAGSIEWGPQVPLRDADG